jgi:Helicase associated domain
VNRQRSMYQAGKLRKDRQVALEKVGLKWSVLTSITWESMFDTLWEYVEERKESTGRPWDGNVPATYKTVKDDPPRALGRWINRQRSKYSKNQLKEEYVTKLNSIGLRWSIHDRKGKKNQDSAASSDADAAHVSPDILPEQLDTNDGPDEVGSMEMIAPEDVPSGPSPMEPFADASADLEDVDATTSSEQA